MVDQLCTILYQEGFRNASKGKAPIISRGDVEKSSINFAEDSKGGTTIYSKGPVA